MGIKYMIDFPCRPKKELGEENMINLVKQARDAVPDRTLGTVASAQYMEVPREGGGETPEAKLKKDLAQLDFFVSDCLSCPVNIASDERGLGAESAFGCIYRIEYPIRKAVETALLKGALVTLADPAANPGSKLVMGILRSHAKGKKTPAHRVRVMGREYFEAKSAQGAKVEISGKRLTLDTDQLMTLLMIGPVPSQATTAFAALLDKGIEQAKLEGIVDPWVLAPLKNLSAHMMAAHKVGKQIKVTY